MDYTRLSDEAALDILENEFGTAEVAAVQSQIISAPDVLYYADAYGDLDSAIKLQGWDKTLSTTVHKGLLESGYDIAEASNCHDITPETCASCDGEMYRFDLPGGSDWTTTEWADEYGNVTGEWVEFVSDIGGHYWDASGESSHAPVLCDACSHDLGYDFPRSLDSSGMLVVHYGETEERSAFAVKGNLVRWDFMAFDEMTDLWGLPGDEAGLPVALVRGGVSDWLDEHGWVEVAQEAVKSELSARGQTKTRGIRQGWRKITEEWSTSTETHPDLPFTYVIDHFTFGSPSFLVPEERRDELIAEVAWLLESRL